MRKAFLVYLPRTIPMEPGKVAAYIGMVGRAFEADKELRAFCLCLCGFLILLMLAQGVPACRAILIGTPALPE